MEKLTTPEPKLRQALDDLEKCFAGKSGLPITESASGTPRIRAYVTDEDGYAGYTSNSSYLGVAKISKNGQTIYVAERHFPNRSKPFTYFWEFNPTAWKLSLLTHEGDKKERPLDLPIEADETWQGYFMRLASDILHTYRFNDYDNGYLGYAEKYQFQLDELQ